MSKKVLILSGSPRRAAIPTFCAMSSPVARRKAVTR